jgi:hypothetical protein
MVRLYFDIETYRKEAFKDENIIAIGTIEDWTPNKKESLENDGELRIFSEWNLGSEKEIIREFYSYVFDLKSTANFLIVVGFGILRFDIPLLIQKGVRYGYSFPQLNAFWYDAYTIDFFQAMLPANNFMFRGNSLENLVKEAAKAGEKITELYGSGEDVKRWYEEKKYKEIEKHLKVDLKAIREVDLTGTVSNILKAKLIKNR